LLPGLQRRTEQLLQNLRGVTLTRPTRQLLDACRITRLNRHYQPSLQLCRLVVDQAGIALDAGETTAPAFFFPMQDVFQEAVTSLLRDRLPAVTRQASASHHAIAGGPQRSLGYAPDIVVGSPPRLVIDTKYARALRPSQHGGWSYRSNGVYQAVFYALSLGCPALLVYPKDDVDVDVQFQIDQTQASIVTVDLQQEGLTGLEELAGKVAELAGCNAMVNAAAE
jgi:5-methylcytosine-specific restriction enzyme subunit McrC